MILAQEDTHLHECDWLLQVVKEAKLVFAGAEQKLEMKVDYMARKKDEKEAAAVAKVRFSWPCSDIPCLYIILQLRGICQ